MFFILYLLGTASVSGYDIRSEMDQVRESLGLCPQVWIFNLLEKC